MLKSFSIIYGLSADPIHLGHEQAIINGIEYCREKGFEIKQLLLIPVYQPHLIADKNTPIASFEHRFAMCDLVAQRLSKQLSCAIQVSEIEKQIVETTNEKNYSYNTVKRMIGEIPAYAGMTGSFDGYLFMVSADHFAGRWPKFRRWFKWQELLKYSGLLINHRPGHTINLGFIQQLRQSNPDIYIINRKKTIGISSSKIRMDLKATLKYLSEDVSDYLVKNKLYINPVT